MKRVLIAAICLFLPWQGLLGTPPPLPKFPPLQFHPPQPERVTFENGMVVYLLEDHELPLIKMNMYFEAGTQYDPPDKVGLGSVFGEAMTFGGSASHTPEEVEQILDRKAASIAVSISLESGESAMSCRRDDFKTIFDLYADLLLHPSFRKDKLELAKSKALESLRRMNDDPEEVARREFRKLMYGPLHPYARIASPESIKAIHRQDLLDAHHKYFRPNRCYLAVSGDFLIKDMVNDLRRVFGAWPKSDVHWPAIPAPVPPLGRRLFYIQRAINQSQIRIGELGLARHSPDHFAWEVFNELWGGSASSLLFRKVRTEMGLAYAVGSGFSEPQERGLIVAVSQTRGSQTIAATQAILGIEDKVREAPFSGKEIADAKDSIRNRFVQNFTSSAQIASYRASLDYFGFPSDYLDTYTSQVGKVEPADLKRVGETFLHPDRTTILLMGDLSTFEKPVSTLGHPQEIQVTDYAQDR